MHGRSRMTMETLAPLICRDRARRVFIDQADIAGTECEASILQNCKLGPLVCVALCLTLQRKYETDFRTS